MNPYIGILLSERIFQRINKYRKTENVQFYVRSAQKHRLTAFFISLKSINVKKGVANGYIYQNKKFKRVKKRIPSVIHNRTMPRNPLLRKKLSLLNQKAFVYNLRTRYSKYTIHKLLWKNRKLRPHVPHTLILSKRALNVMMKRFPVLYVKPASGSIGAGVVKLARQHKRWTMQHTSKRRKINKNKAYARLKKIAGKKTFIVQEGIDLAKYKNRPFDLRVSVQKSLNGKWQVTGIVAKVAGKGKHVTNIARGGSAKPFKTICRHCGWSTRQIKSLKRVSLKIAKHLDRKLPNLADVGFDIGVNRKGKPFFIEMNGKDQRYSFKEAGMARTWFRTYENPIAYGKYLLKKN